MADKILNLCNYLQEDKDRSKERLLLREEELKIRRLESLKRSLVQRLFKML